MRIGSMIKQLLEEVRAAELDESSRERLRKIYDTSISELRSALSPALQDELARLATPCDEEAPSGPELRIATAQLLGCLGGLFHGSPASLFAQHLAPRHQPAQTQTRRSAPGGRLATPFD